MDEKLHVGVLRTLCLDVLWEIFSFIEPVVISTRMRRVCKRFRDIIENSTDFWENIIMKENIIIDDSKSFFQEFVRCEKTDLLVHNTLNELIIRYYSNPFVIRNVLRKDIPVMTEEEIQTHERNERNLQYEKNDSIYHVLDSMIIHNVKHFSGVEHYQERYKDHDVFNESPRNKDAGRWLSKAKWCFFPVGDTNSELENHPYDPYSAQNYYEPWKEVTKFIARNHLSRLFEDYRFFVRKSVMLSSGKWKNYGRKGRGKKSVKKISRKKKQNVKKRKGFFPKEEEEEDEDEEEESEEEIKMKKKMTVFIEDVKRLKKLFFTENRKDTRYFTSVHICRRREMDMARDSILAICDSRSVKVYWSIILRKYG